MIDFTCNIQSCSDVDMHLATDGSEATARAGRDLTDVDSNLATDGSEGTVRAGRDLLLKMCAKYTLEAFEGSPNTWEPPPCIRKEKGTKTKITLVFNILPQDKSKSSDYGLWFRNGLGLETCSHH